MNINETFVFQMIQDISPRLLLHIMKHENILLILI